MRRSPLSEPNRVLLAGIAALALCVGLGAIIALAGNGPLGPDAGWLEYWREHRSPVLTAISLWLNDAGGRTYLGFIAPAAIALLLFITRRPVAAGAILTAGLVGPLAVTLIKALLLRPRPNNPDIVVTLTAYPSGHVSNLVVLLVLVGMILGRRWWWPIASLLTVAMAFSRTYLNAHWATDTLGGILLGTALALLIWAATLRLEPPMRNESPPGATKRR